MAAPPTSPTLRVEISWQVISNSPNQQTQNNGSTISECNNISKYFPKHISRSIPGIEPGTSCTRSRNHTSRPNGRHRRVSLHNPQSNTSKIKKVPILFKLLVLLSKYFIPFCFKTFFSARRRRGKPNITKANHKSQIEFQTMLQ